MLSRILTTVALLIFSATVLAGAPVVTNSGHALEDASIVFHDYLHDTYGDAGLYPEVVSASHEMEEAATELHDLLHDVAEGTADPADVPAAFDAAAAAHQELKMLAAASGLIGADSTARDMLKVVNGEYKQLKKDLKKDGLI